MNLFPFPLDEQKLRSAHQIAARLGDDGRDFFSPVSAVRNYLRDTADAKLAQAITVRGPSGYRALQQDLQRYGKHYNGTKAHYLSVIALAIWELSRRTTEQRFGKVVVPTFGEIASVVASSGFQPPTARWSTEAIVMNLAKGRRSYCAVACEDGNELASIRGKLAPGEQVGLTALLLSLDADVLPGL